MSNPLPEQFISFMDEYPEIHRHYEALGKACHEAGPLDAGTRRLVKLALSIACGSEGAVHAQVRRALDEGVPEEALKQIALLAIPTIGFPKSMAALTWIKDLTDKEK